MPTLLKQKSWSFLFAIVFVFSNVFAAQAADEQEIPDVVLSGLRTYRSETPNAAFKVWLVGSPMENEGSLMVQGADMFQKTEAHYGKYREFQLIKTVNLTPTSKIIYLQMNFEKGPLFAKFLCYRTDLKWIIAMFDFHTKAEIILPPGLLDGSVR